MYCVCFYTVSETKFLNSVHYLADTFDYDIQAINAKITQPSDINYSDDELTFLPYYTYKFSGSSLLKNQMEFSVSRTWHTVTHGNVHLFSQLTNLSEKQLVEFHLWIVWTFRVWT
jgi:hypothetical protein